METITHILETKRNGNKIVRIFFLCGDSRNILMDSQHSFTKEEKRVAKENYSLSLKASFHQEKRKELVEHLVKQEFPNWNIKVGFLK